MLSDDVYALRWIVLEVVKPPLPCALNAGDLQKGRRKVGDIDELVRMSGLNPFGVANNEWNAQATFS